MAVDIKKIIKQMTWKKKQGCARDWIFGIPSLLKRLGIPSIMMTDGPHGLRKQREDAEIADINNAILSSRFRKTL